MQDIYAIYAVLTSGGVISTRDFSCADKFASTYPSRYRLRYSIQRLMFKVSINIDSTLERTVSRDFEWVMEKALRENTIYSTQEICRSRIACYCFEVLENSAR